MQTNSAIAVIPGSEKLAFLAASDPPLFSDGMIAAVFVSAEKRLIHVTVRLW